MTAPVAILTALTRKARPFWSCLSCWPKLTSKCVLYGHLPGSESLAQDQFGPALSLGPMVRIPEFRATNPQGSQTHKELIASEQYPGSESFRPN